MTTREQIANTSSSDTDLKHQYLSTSDQSAPNKRALKQQSKKETKPISSEEESDGESCDDEQNNGSSSLTTENKQNLTRKKQEYLEQVIKDKNGVFSYEDDPSRYKKARKRLQNRESAIRSRVKKREEVSELEAIVRQLEESKAAMESENQALKRQNEYFQQLFAKQQNVVVPSETASSGAQSEKMTQPKINVGNISTETQGGGPESSHEYPSQKLDVPEIPMQQPLEMTRGNFYKRQKITDIAEDFLNKEPQEPFAGVTRQDSFFSDVPAYNLMQRQDSIAFETGSEQLTQKIPSLENADQEQTPLLVLQRNQMSIGAFLANNGIFSLTIVCAVLGVVTSYQDSSQQNDQSQGQIRSGQILKAASDTKYRCEQFGECQAAVLDAFWALLSAVKMFLASLPRVSLCMYILSIVLFLVWLKPLKMLHYMMKPQKSHKSSSSKKRRSTSSRSSGSAASVASQKQQ